MQKVPGQARAEIVSAEHPQSRLAILRYQVRRWQDYGSWLEVRLETGRTHQIRLQCSSRGHPVLGDRQYGATCSFGPQVEDLRDCWIALHARQLGFEHPKNRDPVSVTAPIPTPWLTLRPRPHWESERDD
jgi:23S rRNA-/tRNA-specific pseudouridylate synthase